MKTNRVVGVLAGVAVVGGLAFWGLDGTQVHAADPEPQELVPVTVANARVQDVPVYLDGLGTVQAFNTVEVKAQVNGTLIALPAREGQEVHKGDIVAEIDPKPYQAALDQAMAQRQEDQATLQSAQLDLVRYRTLAKSEFAPVQQVDDQQATVNKTNAAIAADSAAIETAQINLGYCVIRAPFDGRVSLYQVDVGNLIQVASQTGIVSITQDKPIAVVFTLPEANLARVQTARQAGPVQVLVTDPSNDKQLAEGTLMTPNNTIDTSTGTISLKAEFKNADDHLWPGEFLNARVKVEVLPKAVTIPSLAVEHGPSGLFVYTLKQDQTVAAMPIEVGYEDGGQSVVTKGLSGNESVLTAGQSRVSPGMRVKPTSNPVAASGGPTQAG